MKPPTSVFQLARMRRTDLLAIWHRLHPDSHDMDGRQARVAQLTNDQLVAAILEARAPRT